MDLAINFNNLGPYHLARLRAAADGLARRGDRLIAIETAATERRYPWRAERRDEPFHRVVLHEGRTLEDIPAADCARSMEEVLRRLRPDVVASVGYVRPEALAAARWARREGRPAVLLSESQEIDRPRTWWKERIKRFRVGLFDAGLVGGPSHRDYLRMLGMPSGRIALGYNAVDNDAHAKAAEAARRDPEGRDGLPQRPYFLAVCRFSSEKNLPALIAAFGDYRRQVGEDQGWDLALCGDGPDGFEVDRAVRRSNAGRFIHRPGFLQADQLAPWYAFASTFVLPSLSEPWGLVVNEAAACGLPLLVSDRAGASGTLVPDPVGSTGRRLDPTDIGDMTEALIWMSSRTPTERSDMGRRAAEIVSQWGPERFASGLLEAVDLAVTRSGRRLAAAS